MSLQSWEEQYEAQAALLRKLAGEYRRRPWRWRWLARLRWWFL